MKNTLAAVVGGFMLLAPMYMAPAVIAAAPQPAPWGAARDAAVAEVVRLAQDEPVSAVQLCAATDIDQVDALLARVADTELVQDLAPLASLTVPRDPDGVVLAANVDLDQVRTALNCQPSTPDPTSEPTAEPTTTSPPPTTDVDEPTGTTTPTTPPSGFSQLSDVPSAAAETGAGPA